jgi:hypothetical protein
MTGSSFVVRHSEPQMVKERHVSEASNIPQPAEERGVPLLEPHVGKALIA